MLAARRSRPSASGHSLPVSRRSEPGPFPQFFREIIGPLVDVDADAGQADDALALA